MTVNLAGDQWPWPEIPLGSWKMVVTEGPKNRSTLDVGNSMNIQAKVMNNILPERS